MTLEKWQVRMLTANIKTTLFKVADLEKWVEKFQKEGRDTAHFDLEGWRKNLATEWNALHTSLCAIGAFDGDVDALKAKYTEWCAQPGQGVYANPADFVESLAKAKGLLESPAQSTPTSTSPYWAKSYGDSDYDSLDEW